MDGQSNGKAVITGAVSGKHEHRTIKGGLATICHKEAPQAFAKAVVDVDGY